MKRIGLSPGLRETNKASSGMPLDSSAISTLKASSSLLSRTLASAVAIAWPIQARGPRPKGR